jgi:putative transposase
MPIGREPVSLCNFEDLRHERGIDLGHETIRYQWQRFGPTFASEIKKRRIERTKSSRWRGAKTVEFCFRP